MRVTKTLQNCSNNPEQGQPLAAAHRSAKERRQHALKPEGAGRSASQHRNVAVSRSKRPEERQQVPPQRPG